jgi:preprotein translocase subunit SecD
VVGVSVLVTGCTVVSTTTTAATVAPGPLTSESPAPVLDLQLRPVLTVETAGVADCTITPPPTPAAANEVTLCSQDLAFVYSLGPAAVVGARVTGLETSLQGGRPVIQVRLDPRGASQLSTITGQIMGEQPPRSQLAIVAHGRVQSAPVVGEQIDGGVVILSGFATDKAAQDAIDFLEAPPATGSPSARSSSASSTSRSVSPSASASSTG